MKTTTTAVSGSWTEVSMKKAASEFEVPAGTKFLLVFPDIFDRDILLEHESYKFDFVDKDGGKHVGVKTPCPWCNTNEFVKCGNKTGFKSERTQ